MASVDELINKGLVLSGRQMERGRIFIVTGLYRSGTSLVDSIPQRTGRFMGGQINDVVSPEEELFSILEQLPARPE